MEVIKSIVYQDKNAYDSEIKDPSTLYIVNDSTLSLYFRGMRLKNVVYQESFPDNLSPDCFYIVNDCLYYVGEDRKTIFKLFDSKVVDIVKTGDTTKFIYKDGSQSTAVTVDSDYRICSEDVRSYIIDRVGEIDLTVDWDKWGG